MSSITARVNSRFRSLPDRIFSIDLRSLALFRAVVAFLLLIDLLRHLPLLQSFYSDDGLWPRGWQSNAENLWRISLHAATGQTLFELLLLMFAVLAALALFVGWRTRLAAVLSFVLYASLLNRATVVADGAEQWLALLLFWGCFLPLNLHWSVDAAAAAEHDVVRADAHRSWASAALLLQIGIAFIWITALAPGANPVAAILSQQAYSAPAGLWLQRHDILLSWVQWLSCGIGIVAPLLLFSSLPRLHLRSIAVIALALVQVGALIGFDLGLAPWVALAALTPFIGSAMWTRLSANRANTNTAIRLFHDQDRPGSLWLHRLLREFLILPTAQLLAAQSQPRTATLLRANDSWIVIDHDDHAYLRWDAWALLLRRSPLFGPLGWLLAKLPLRGLGDTVYRLIRRIDLGAPSPGMKSPAVPGKTAQRFAGLCLLLILLWNLTLAGLLPNAMQGLLAPPLRLLRLDQPWNHYLPQGIDRNGWFVVPGTLANGQKINLLRPDQPLDFAAPAVLARRQGSGAWHRYLDLLSAPQDDRDHARYAAYLCRRWNQHATAGRRLQLLKIVYLLERDPRASGEGIEQHVLWRQDCYAAAGTAASDG